MKRINWLLVLIGVWGVIGVRVMENTLFYDPFLTYFKEMNFDSAAPQVEYPKLVLSHLFRYALNIFFSAILVQGLFRNREWTKQSVALMLMVLVFVLPIYLYCISTDLSLGYLFTFYNNTNNLPQYFPSY